MQILKAELTNYTTSLCEEPARFHKHFFFYFSFMPFFHNANRYAFI